jgi:hypothetical protein
MVKEIPNPVAAIGSTMTQHGMDLLMMVRAKNPAAPTAIPTIIGIRGPLRLVNSETGEDDRRDPAGPAGLYHVGGDRKQRDHAGDLARHVETFAAPATLAGAHPARRQQQAGEDHRVAVHHPLQSGYRRAEPLAKLRQRHVDDRRVDHTP